MALLRSLDISTTVLTSSTPPSVSSYSSSRAENGSIRVSSSYRSSSLATTTSNSATTTFLTSTTPPSVPSYSSSRAENGSVRVSSSQRSSSLATTTSNSATTTFLTSSIPQSISSYSSSRAENGSIRLSSSYQSSSISNSATTTSKSFMQCSRRQGISLCAASVLLVASPGSVLAEENVKKEEGGTTFVDGVLELFDPDQVTKTGKKLPKKYVKSVRDVVKNLRESFTQDSNDGAKFRRNADSAKESIREYLQNWRGSKLVEAEDSYIALERAFRELGKFYSSKGPQAALPEDIRNRVLEDLNKADDSI